MYDAILSQVVHPISYTSTHLRHQILMFIMDNAEQFLQLQGDHIQAVYGVPAVDDEQAHGGPFSLVTWLQHQSRAETWGDGIILYAVSLMWDVTLSVVSFDGWRVTPFRHEYAGLSVVDILLLFNGRSHYSGLGELQFFHRFLLLVLVVCASVADPFRFDADPFRSDAEPFS